MRPGFRVHPPVHLPLNAVVTDRRSRRQRVLNVLVGQRLQERLSGAVLLDGGRFTSRSGWVFNNMTYLPSSRALWKNNNLGHKATWKTGGRQWRTECDTAVTGRNGCRSYIYGQLVEVTKTSGGSRYSVRNDWIFNNMVQFN